MLSPRWIKLLRDLRLARGRMAMMIVAIAVSLIGVGTVLSTYSILSREIEVNYLGTNPAHATLDLGRVDADLVKAVQQRPGIARAEARSMVMARIRKDQGSWLPLLLFVVKDFKAMGLSTFRSQSGAWPPPKGTMLMERTAMEMFRLRTGDSVTVQAPSGTRQAVTVSGVVHDPGLAPAWQEREGYGYVTPETLEYLGESGVLQDLKIQISGEKPTREAIDAAARELGVWLGQQGHEVHEIQVPPPRMHPHQGQMIAVLTMLMLFAAMALLLSAILVSTMIGGLLAQQIRQIGVMKAIGGTTRQVAGIYVILVTGLSLVALGLAIPLGLAAGRLFAQLVSQLLNFTLTSTSVPAWVFLVQGAAGILVPLTVALMPIVRVSRMTVREALSDHGVSPESATDGNLAGKRNGLPWLDRSLQYALRNTFRRRGRLALTLGLLAAGGAMFMTGLNTRVSWLNTLEKAFEGRRYDYEVRFNRPEPSAPLLAKIRAIPGVKASEAWGYSPTALSRPGQLDVSRTYPDGGHGLFSIRGIPDGSDLIRFPMQAGRWLRPDDANEVVLTHLARNQLPDVKVGDTVTLSVEGRPQRLQVVGLMQEIGSPATAYVPLASFERLTGQTGRARSLRVVYAAHDPESRRTIQRAINQVLDEAQVSVGFEFAGSELRTAIGEHMTLLIGAILFMAVLMAIVGVLGLMSTMSTNTVERTREFAVIRAIGGTPATVIRCVVSEGLFIGVMSWGIAIALGIPLTLLVGTVVGNLTFRVPLTLILSPEAAAGWLVLTLLGAAGASALPAWRASKLTVNEALAHT